MTRDPPTPIVAVVSRVSERRPAGPIEARLDWGILFIPLATIVFKFGIFEPGFTTTKEVTDLSGRGVGMDVVRTNIEKIGGGFTSGEVVAATASFCDPGMRDQRSARARTASSIARRRRRWPPPGARTSTSPAAATCT